MVPGIRYWLLHFPPPPPPPSQSCIDQRTTVTFIRLAITNNLHLRETDDFSFQKSRCVNTINLNRRFSLIHFPSSVVSLSLDILSHRQSRSDQYAITSATRLSLFVSQVQYLCRVAAANRLMRIVSQDSLQICLIMSDARASSR